ncbi:MAG: beta-galactosidase [Acidimicrobiales bacterium]|nr:beta-galactosidase [Hyphomonadaceae bacterium]RZV45110.1 MAG: beta-galactosidase [Acidimicrobiales bacterium]
MSATIPNLGVCYYPEHWPESEWAQDAARMTAAGIQRVRIGEFAWSRIEPREGEFNWGWLDTAIETLGSAGLDIILGTPTATPPRWMVAKHPDMLAYDHEGRPRTFGSRRHYCFSHEGYKRECARIADALGHRYGGNSYIQGWQIDNEYGCHDTTVSYSPAARDSFQKWLMNKYKSPAALNTAWGNVFWSMEYGDFDEIGLPNLTVTEPNPAHILDFRCFSSDQVVAFNRAQCETLRAHTDKPLIHNYMGRITDFDHFEVGSDLDIASWDSYPLGFLEDRSDLGDEWRTKFMRQGDPDFQAFHHDLYRAVGKGRWWVMEQQPGPVNWAPYNPAPLTGMARLWTWEAIAHGAETVSYFRWRQAPFAQEQMHAGLLRPDGEDASVMGEVKRVAQEIATIGKTETRAADVAIVFDYTSAWAWDTQPQGQDFDYFRLVFDFYRQLRRLGLSIDILPPNMRDFGNRKLVVIPGLMSWSDNLRQAIDNFSGHVLIGPRSGSKTSDFQIPAALPPDLDGLDVKITAVESRRPGGEIALEKGGQFRIWREFIETNAEVVEASEDGHPALLKSDNLYYLCGWPDDTAMIRILEQMATTAGVDIEHLPTGVRCRTFGNKQLYVNYAADRAVVGDHEINGTDILLVDQNNKRLQ